MFVDLVEVIRSIAGWDVIQAQRLLHHRQLRTLVGTIAGILKLFREPFLSFAQVLI